MTNDQIVGLIGGIGGGLFGTFVPMRNMKLPALRRWYLRTAAIAWFVVIAFGALVNWLMHTHPPLAWIGWGIYPFILLLGIRYMNNGMKKFQSGGEPSIQTKERPDADIN